MKRKQIELRLQHKEAELKKLHLQPSTADINNRQYNRLILEKAILKKELENFGKNYFVEKAKRFFTKKETLICDE